jgi:hypothetical protein
MYFFYSIFKQKSILIYFLIFILFGATSIYTLTHGIIDYITPFIASFFLYLAVSSCINYYYLHTIITNINKKHIKHELKLVTVEVQHAPLNTTSFYKNYQVKIPISPDRKQMEVLVSNNFIIIAIIYKEMFFFNRIGKPLYIPTNDNNTAPSLKYVKRIGRDKLLMNGSDLIILFSKEKKLIIQNFQHINQK